MDSRQKLLFFTRGRGRGHAIPDLAIAEELGRLAPEVEVKFASYSTGAQTLREAGHQVLDLDLPDEASHHPLLTRAGQAIIRSRPQLVVSHEEFAALPAAKIFGLPTAFIVDFFPTAALWNECLRYADRVLFIERQGIFAEPAEVKGRLRYLGPVLRPLTVGRDDRERTRRELDLPATAKVVSVIPGAWANEQRAPIFDLVVSAFEALPFPEKKLVWNAGADQATLQRRLTERRGGQPAPDVIVLGSCSPVEKLMVASDLSITKANRGTTIDLARLGIPSISLSSGANPYDEAILPRLQSNLALDVRGVDGPFLTAAIQTIFNDLEQGATCSPSPLYRDSAARPTAQEILQLLHR